MSPEQVENQVKKWKESMGALRPITGKVIIQLDRVNAIRQIGILYVVDTSHTTAPVRRATVLAISRGGGVELGHRTRPHVVKPGDRVIADMKACLPMPGFEDERVYTLWEQYIFGWIEDEVPVKFYGDVG